MHRVIETGGAKDFVNPAEGRSAFFFVKWTQHSAAQGKQFAAVQHRLDQSLSDVGIGESGDCRHGGERFDDRGRGDHGCGPGSRQPEFAQAQSQNGGRGPERRGLGENDPRKGSPIRIVNDQGDSVGIGQSGQSVDFIVGQHVARRIGRAGDNHGRDVATGQRCCHGGKIDAIFEFPGGFALRPFNRRTAGDKTFRF